MSDQSGSQSALRQVAVSRLLFGASLPLAGLYYMASLTAPVTRHLVGRYSDRTGNRLMAVLANFCFALWPFAPFPGRRSRWI
jgi:hypothetical protein